MAQHVWDVWVVCRRRVDGTIEALCWRGSTNDSPVVFGSPDTGRQWISWNVEKDDQPLYGVFSAKLAIDGTEIIAKKENVRP